jgi:hypothetical protein
MTFWAEMLSALVSDFCIGQAEEHPYFFASSLCGYSTLWHFATEDTRLCGSDESSLGVFPSQPSPFYAQETQLPSSSLL